MADPDGPAATVPMQVGDVVGRDGVPSRDDGAAEARADRPANSRQGRMLGTALALAVGLAVAFTVVGVQDRSPRTVVVTPPFGEPWAAADAPAHQVIRRWEWAAPERTQLAALAVHGQLVVVQTLPLDRGQDTDPTTVTAIDTLTGEEAWSVDVAMSRPDGPRGLELAPTVHVVEESAATTLTPTVQAWPRGTSVGLDAASGRVVWRRDDVLGVARPVGQGVLAVSHPVADPANAASLAVTTDATDGTTSSEGADDTGSQPPDREVVDLRTGRTVFTTGGVLAATRTGWVAWDRRDDDRWTARILTDVGAPVAELPSDARPVVLDDLVMTLQGSEVVATDLDGHRVWATSAPEVVRTPTPRVATLLPVGPDLVLASVHHVADQPVPGTDGDRRVTTLTLVHADGTTTPVADPTLLDVAAAASFVGVLDRETLRLLCTATSPAQVRRPAGCPAAVAVLRHDEDHDVLAPSTTVPATTTLGTHLDTPAWVNAVPTVPGVVVAEPGAIVLRAWQDLAPLWRIAVDDRRPGSITIVTSARGVAVGAESSVPSTVTWLS